MKRMGRFCDTGDCKQAAIGACVCCDKDCCQTHGSTNGIALHVMRAVRGTTSQSIVTTGSTTVCYVCSDRITSKPKLFDETVLPELLARVGDAMKAALSAEALK